MGALIGRAEKPGRPGGTPAAWACLSIAAVSLLAQLWLIFVTEFNWDEFFYLSHIHEYARGELTGALQTIHVHSFGRLTSLPGNELDQLEAGRLVMLLFQAVTCVLIYSLARAFFDRVPSLLAVLAFVSAGSTIMHGASFRADPLATALTMLSLTAIARGRMNGLTAVVAAAAAAVAALVTVKVILYAPAFAGIAAWRIAAVTDRSRGVWWIAATGAAAAFLSIILYALHASTLSATDSAGPALALAGAGQTTFVEAGFLPRANEILKWALLSPIAVALMLLGLGATGSRFGQRFGPPWRSIAILSCAAPMLSLFFYRNAFPYFFPFITAPPSILVAAAVQNTDFLRRWPMIVAAPFAASAIAVALTWAKERPQLRQQQLVAAVHRIFPEPVPYIDRNSMIATFPKRGFFMSTWGMQDYRRGRPIFAALLSLETIPLLIVNGPALEHVAGGAPNLPESLRLFPEDEQVLRRNFIPHWGHIWVAGQSVEAGPAGSPISIAIPGTYTVEGGPVVIDGYVRAAGATVNLGRGTHEVRSAKPQLVTLRWGNNLYRPAGMVADSLYRGF